MSDRAIISKPLLDILLGSNRIVMTLERWKPGMRPSLRIARIDAGGREHSFAFNPRTRFDVGTAVLAWITECERPSSPPSAPANALPPPPPASGPSGDADASEGIVVAGTR